MSLSECILAFQTITSPYLTIILKHSHYLWLTAVNYISAGRDVFSIHQIHQSALDLRHLASNELYTVKQWILLLQHDIHNVSRSNRSDGFVTIQRQWHTDVCLEFVTGCRYFWLDSFIRCVILAHQSLDLLVATAQTILSRINSSHVNANDNWKVPYVNFRYDCHRCVDNRLRSVITRREIL